MIIAHLPDGVCRIRITTEPMFSRSEFVPLVLESMLEGESKLVIDLGLVSMLHSPSLANLVTIHITLAKRGSEMILTGLHEKNLRILQITKLDRLFTVSAAA
jgi:anti-anti-sigma factor